eukprot:scaffold351813_cov15-Prasinocladus_malaysianus.AAC.1
MRMIETQAVGSVGLRWRDSWNSFAFVGLSFCTDLELMVYLLIDKQPATSLWRQQAGAVRLLIAQENAAPSNAVADRDTSGRGTVMPVVARRSVVINGQAVISIAHSSTSA